MRADRWGRPKGGLLARLKGESPERKLAMKKWAFVAASMGGLPSTFVGNVNNINSATKGRRQRVGIPQICFCVASVFSHPPRFAPENALRGTAQSCGPVPVAGVATSSPRRPSEVNLKFFCIPCGPQLPTRNLRATEKTSGMEARVY